MQQPGSPCNWLRQLPLLCIIQSCAHPSLTNPVMICDAQVLDTCSFGNKWLLVRWWTPSATLPFDETRWSVGRMDYDGSSDGSSQHFQIFSDPPRGPVMIRHLGSRGAERSEAVLLGFALFSPGFRPGMSGMIASGFWSWRQWVLGKGFRLNCWRHVYHCLPAGKSRKRFLL